MFLQGGFVRRSEVVAIFAVEWFSSVLSYVFFIRVLLTVGGTEREIEGGTEGRMR